MVCFIAGGYLLLGGISTGLGILCVLIGLWLALDNPLEGFEILEGPCPSCGQEVRARRRVKLRCSVCEKPITVDPHTPYLGNSLPIANLQSKVGEGAWEDVSQVEPVEPAVIGPSDTLDLHTFSPKEVPSLLREFIHQSQKAGVYLVKIIHGKGTGALRRRVQGLLARDPRVLAFYDAPRESGGWGATLVELRPHGEESEDQPGG